MSKFFTNVSVAKNNILLCGYENGVRIKEEIPYKPYLFTGSGGGYKTLEGKSVGRIDFDSIREARDFMQQYKDVDNFKIYGMNQFVYPFIFDHYPGEIEYDPAQISVTTIDIEVDIADEKGFPNIQEANNEITLITISRNGRKTVFGCQPYVVKEPNVKFIMCKDEVELLEKFLRVWNSDDYSPDIVTGWNVEFFDIPYIINRIIRILGRKFASKLSPWRFIRDRKVARAFSTEEDQVWEIVGVTILDYMQLYKKFGYSIQESYSLDHIAFAELGERKLDYGEYGSLAGLQVGNWERYVDYNIKDVELVDRLDDKLGLIGLVLAMAYDAKVNYQDTFTTVRAWDVIIHNYLLERGIVVPPLAVADHHESIIGGYVKDPQVGMHEWVVSFDLASLYPHIIMQYNISPETFHGRFPGIPGAHAKDLVDKMYEGVFSAPEFKEYLKTNNVCVTANMLNFKRDRQGFLPALMSKYYDERNVYKDKMIAAQKALEKIEDRSVPEAVQLVKDISKFHNLQMSKKIQINSAYGALGNKFFRWHRTEFAEAITSSGQLTTRWAERALNTYLNKVLKTNNEDYVIACDTDSVYIRLGPLVDQLFTKEEQKDKQKITKFLDNLCVQKLKTCIDTAYNELRDYVNATENKMNMKRECIADKGIWTAKKRYILNVYNKEGVAYDKPKLKMMGIEAIRTSTPQVCRDAIKEGLVVIMNETETELQGYVKQFLNKFEKLPFEEVASPRSVSDLESYQDASSIYRKGTPINAKGSLIYNHYLKKLKLDKKYEAISPGQKIKYSYCVQPNPLNCTVIAAPGGKLPDEFGMDRYLDRYKQYDKSFLEPIKTITNAIGWQVEKKANLTSFFGD